MTASPTPVRSAKAPAFIVGVDGGGTGTRARLMDSLGKRLAEGEAGPSALGQGIAQAWSNVLLAIEAAFSAAAVPVPDLSACALGLGMAGAGAPSRVAALRAAAPPWHSLAVDTDIGAALRGAHGGLPGAVVAAGTGSVGAALRRDGRRLLVGGWGFGIGDEGSGAWMGQAAVRVAQAAFDGRGPVGSLAMAVWQRCGSHREALVEWCAAAGQNSYAQLAPLVFDAEGSDSAARAILDDAAAALSRIADALDPEGELPVVVMGGIGPRLQARLPIGVRSRCTVPKGDAMDGALHIIREQLTRPFAG